MLVGREAVGSEKHTAHRGPAPTHGASRPLVLMLAWAADPSGSRRRLRPPSPEKCALLPAISGYPGLNAQPRNQMSPQERPSLTSGLPFQHPSPSSFTPAGAPLCPELTPASPKHGESPGFEDKWMPPNPRSLFPPQPHPGPRAALHTHAWTPAWTPAPFSCAPICNLPRPDPGLQGHTLAAQPTLGGQTQRIGFPGPGS